MKVKQGELDKGGVIDHSIIPAPDDCYLIYEWENEKKEKEYAIDKILGFKGTLYVSKRLTHDEIFETAYLIPLTFNQGEGVISDWEENPEQIIFIGSQHDAIKKYNELIELQGGHKE